MSKKLVFFEAIAVLVGTIIGAGILGIPYVVAQSGFLTGLVVLIVIAGAMMLLNLLLGEMVLSTKNRYQLSGYVAKYLGPWGKYLMLFFTIFSFSGALLAYLIGEGKVLASLTGGSAWLYSLLFLLFGAVLIYLGLAVVKRLELVMTLAILFIVLIIGLWGFNLVNLDNLASFSWQKLMIPYGVIFFAMSGISAIPHLRFVLKGREKSVKKAIIIGVLIPFGVYLLFTLVTVGVSGFKTTEIATIGLGRAIGEIMIVIGNLFAFFTMATSFLTLGLALKETYYFDLKLSYKLSWFLTCFPPLLVFLLGLHNFVKVIAIVGAVGGGLEGLLILAAYLKFKTLKKTERTPEYRLSVPVAVIFLLWLMFLAGAVYTLVY